MIAALVARIVGLGRSTLGAGGGGAAVCGEEASGDSAADEVVAGTTTGGVSPNVRGRVLDTGGT